MSEKGAQSPRVFISYSWTTPDHQDWVLEFASALRASGVDAILDKWHLTEGQDTLAFMETMVSDPAVQKVLLISDRKYAEKADARKGGVGVEAQIVSSKVYEAADQTKFAAVVVELDQDGRPILPQYMASRLYFDMSSREAYADNFPKIVRWIFGKPFHAVPPVGPPPSFLDQTHQIDANVFLEGQRLRHRRNSSAETVADAGSVLEAAAEAARAFVLPLANSKSQDEDAYNAMLGTHAVTEEVSRAFIALARNADDRRTDLVHSFFEKLFRLWDVGPEGAQHTQWDNDPLQFFANNAFVSFVAVCMQEREFAFAADVLSMPFFKPKPLDRTGDVKSYASLQPALRSLLARKQRLGLNRRSLHADLLRDLHAQSIVSFDAFLQADMTLFLRGALKPELRWYPETALYLGDSYGALPDYARATSAKFYNRLRAILFEIDSEKLKLAIERIDREGRGRDDASPAILFNMEKLATTE